MTKNIQKLLDKARSYIYIYIYRLRRQNRENSHQNRFSYGGKMKASGVSNYIKTSRHLRILGISASVSFVCLMTLALFPITKNIGLAEATSGTASTTTLTMTSSQENLNLDLSVTESTGTFAESTPEQLATFNVVTNNYTGYQLSIVGLDDSGNLTNTEEAAVLSSIDAIMGKGEFDDAANNGKWGYKPSKYNGVKNEAYLPSPTTSATMLDKTSSANATATADNTYSIGLGARVNYDTPHGTYSGSFRLVATANPVPYSISFVDNSGDTVAGMPKTLTGDVDNTIVELPTNIPQRAGFTFAGWCDATPTTGADGSSTCPTGSTTYQPSTDATPTYIGIDQTAAMNATTLYALWTAVPVTPTVDVTVNFSGTISAVSFVANGHATGLVSTSGGKATLEVGVAYTMTAYAPHGYEFKTWALNSSSYGTLSSTTANPATFTTNASSSSAVITATSVVPCTPISGTMQNFTAPTSASSCESGTLQDSRDGQIYTVAKLADGKWWMLDNLRLGSTTLATNLTSANTNLSTTIAASTFNSWNKTSGFTVYDSPMINNASANTTTTSYGSGSGKIGVYYNYCAASANTYCMAGGSGSGNASYDVCPKGWRMPTGGSSGEYKALYTAYSSNAANFKAALSTPLSGYFYDSSANNQGDYGGFWSSTYYDGYNMYYLYVYSSVVGPAGGSYRNVGFSVRCVLK